MAKNHIAVLFWADDAVHRTDSPNPLAMTKARFVTHHRNAGDALMHAMSFIRAADGREAVAAMEPMNEEGVSTNGATVLNMAWVGKRKIKRMVSMWVWGFQAQAVSDPNWESPGDIATRGLELLIEDAKEAEEAEGLRSDDLSGPWSAIPPH